MEPNPDPPKKGMAKVKRGAKASGKPSAEAGVQKRTDKTASVRAKRQKKQMQEARATRRDPCDCGRTRQELDALLEKNTDDSGKPIKLYKAYFTRETTDPHCKQGRPIAEHPPAHAGGAAVAAGGQRLDRQPRELVAKVLSLIDPSNVHQPTLTATELNYQQQGDALEWVIDKISGMHDTTKLAEMSTSKGQPIIGTGATSGVGKSRLLEEIRRHYSKTAHVLVVSYNTNEGLTPTQDEKEDLQRAAGFFRSRLLCAMLPPSEVMKHGAPTSRYLSTSFQDATNDDVVEVLAKKFSDGKDVLILVDEVVQLSVTSPSKPPDDTVLHAVISTLGEISHHASNRLGAAKCVGIFTALSKALIEKAKTNSGRNILTPPLPLLSRTEVANVVRAKQTKASEVLIDHIFAITAGHARTLEKVMGAQWKNGHLNQALDTLIPAVCEQASRFVMSEPEIRAILLEDVTAGVDFQKLSRESILHVSTSGGAGDVTIVPAFLYKWCVDNPRSSLAKHLKPSLDAAWERIYLSAAKEGKGGDPLEKFLWHFEAVRRELLAGSTLSVREFFRMTTTPSSWKWHGRYQFPTITGTATVPQPASNKWENFDVDGTVVDSRTRYEPTSGNFPKYDWLSAAEGAKGNIVPMGSQTKHGGGTVQDPADNVASIKFSTRATGVEAWSAKGWLVLHAPELECYLGTSMTAAAASLLHHPAN